MDDPLQSRRLIMTAARRLLLGKVEPVEREPVGDEPPRLTLKALENIRMSRSRERILSNLDDMYREAFERAKGTGDQAQMTTLDFAYRREQLYFEILLDIRDAVETKA
jgi:hypothetical protein